MDWRANWTRNFGEKEVQPLTDRIDINDKTVPSRSFVNIVNSVTRSPNYVFDSGDTVDADQVEEPRIENHFELPKDKIDNIDKTPPVLSSANTLDGIPTWLTETDERGDEAAGSRDSVGSQGKRPIVSHLVIPPWRKKCSDCYHFTPHPKHPDSQIGKCCGEASNGYKVQWPHGGDGCAGYKARNPYEQTHGGKRF
jgi:hypothetical protein